MNHPEFPGIEVSNTGIVREINTGRVIPTWGSGGKVRVRLQDFNGNSRELIVRRMVKHLFGHLPVRVEEPTEGPVEEVNTDSFWADIEHPDILPGYRVSSLGEVMTARGVVLRGSLYKSKYGSCDSRSVQLARRPGSSELIGHVRIRLDELVAQYHMEPAPSDEHQLRHINGDPDDCRAENLEWALLPITAAPDRVKISVRGNRNHKRAVTMSRTMAKILAGDPNWKPVVTTKIAPRRYWVHRDARVMGIYGRELKITTYQDGHLCANIQSAATGATTTVRLDEIVLDAWVGPRPTPLHRALHRNGDITDCAVANLYWGIPGQAHAIQEPTPVPAAPTPRPLPRPLSSFVTDDVEVSTVTSYRYDGVEMRVDNEGRVALPEVTVDNAAALAKLLGRIGQRPASE
jgi:hypothetical protein